LLVTIRHEPLASPEQTIMKYLENNESIRNKKAREITFIKDSDKMKKILREMAKRGEIMGVPGARFGGMAYQKSKKK
jgi:ATP-dependent DNA helicase RecG